MKTVLLLALVSIALVGCESSDAIAKAAKNGSAVVSASAKSRYEYKDGILTFKDALSVELYADNGEDCGFDVEAGYSVTVKELNHEGILFANKDPKYADIPFTRTSDSEINENNLLLGTFELESESDTTYEMNQFKFDQDFIEVTVQCEAK